MAVRFALQKTGFSSSRISRKAAKIAKNNCFAIAPWRLCVSQNREVLRLSLTRWAVRQMGNNAMKHKSPTAVRLLSAAMIWVLLLLASGNVAHAQTTLIEEWNDTRTAFSESSFPCSVPLVYQLTVHDEFSVSKVEFDFVAAHTYRGDVRVTLISPAGTQVLAVYSPGDSFGNFNIRLADDAINPINNGGNDNPDLGTRRLVRPYGALSAFNGQNAQGVWQVQICDALGGDSGEHRLS